MGYVARGEGGLRGFRLMSMFHFEVAACGFTIVVSIRPLFGSTFLLRVGSFPAQFVRRPSDPQHGASTWNRKHDGFAFFVQIFRHSQVSIDDGVGTVSGWVCCSPR